MLGGWSVAAMVDSRSTPGKKKTQRPRISPARRGTIRVALVLGVLLLVNLYVFLWRDSTSIPAVIEQAEALDDGEGGRPGAPPPTPAAAVGAAPAPADGVAPAPAPEPVRIAGTVGKGDTLGKVLRRHGLTAAESDELLRALASVFDFKTLRPGQAFTIERAPDGQLVGFELVVSKVQTVRVVRGADGALAGVADAAQTRVEVEEIGGEITSSLYASVKAAGERTGLVGDFVDLFAYDLDFYVDTHPGDTFKVIVEKEYAGDEFLRYRRILAAEYKGRRETFRAIWWQPPRSKRGRYFDDKGRALEKSMLKTPLKFVRISSKYNPRRMHPVLHKVRGHFGVDYAAPTGTPVWAAGDGVIVKREFGRGPGNHVVIRHDGGLTSTYMHLSKFAKSLQVGQRVAAKTVIGYVGSTGLSTGPHLHFGVKKNGAHVDPLTLAPTRGPGVPKGELAAFKAHASGMVGRMAALPVRRPAAAAVATEDSITAADPEIADDAAGTLGMGGPADEPLPGRP